jgi:hypothetical protein
VNRGVKWIFTERRRADSSVAFRRRRMSTARFWTARGGSDHA